MKRLILIAAMLLTSLVGCGDDESTSSDGSTASSATDVSAATVSVSTDATESDATESTSTSTSTSSDIGELDAIKASITTWLLEGDCDLMTDKFIEQQTFISNRTKGCAAFENLFSAPAYGEDDIEFGDIQYANDKATAIVGGGGSDITSKYTLVFEDDTWRIDVATVN